jgi:ABC-2 type transport system permease protein
LSALVVSTLVLARAHLVRIVQSRRALLTLLLAFLPTLVAVLVTRFVHNARPAELAVNFGWILVVQLVVPLAALICGSSVVAEEIEDRTITFLFTRPIPRASILLGRLAATLVFVSVLMALATAALLWACSGARGTGPAIGAGISQPLIVAAVVGVMVYTTLFAAAGIFFKHPMIVGLAYAFALEGFLANLPGKNQALTIQYYLRSIIASGRDPSWLEVEGVATSNFDSASGAFTTLACIVAAAIVLGVWRLSRREYELSGT